MRLNNKGTVSVVTLANYSAAFAVKIFTPILQVIKFGLNDWLRSVAKTWPSDNQIVLDVFRIRCT